MSGIEDIELTIELAESEDDAELAAEVVDGYDRLDAEIESLRLELLLSGKYDRNNAILSIHAGTGGVDAMDWAEMLLRMYTRWCEKRLQSKADRPAGRYGGRHQIGNADCRG